MTAIPANSPQARPSPLGRTCVDAENNVPDRKGPTLRPAADKVWAIPFKVPRLAFEGAEFVTYPLPLVILPLHLRVSRTHQ